MQPVFWAVAIPASAALGHLVVMLVAGGRRRRQQRRTRRELALRGRETHVGERTGVHADGPLTVE